MKSEQLQPLFTTEYQLYKSITIEDATKNVIDFSEKKLERMSKTGGTLVERQKYEMFLINYREGLIAISWAQGKPKHKRIIKDK